MQRPSLRVLAGAALLAGLSLSFVGLRQAKAAGAGADVLVQNDVDAPAQVAIAHSDEPFHATTQVTIAPRTQAGRVLLFTADRRIVLDHVSGRLVTSEFQTGDFALELEEPGRKTIAVHEVPLVQAWVYRPGTVQIPASQHLRLIASQPMHVIIEPGQSLYFHVQLPYYSDQAQGVATLTASGHYAASQPVPPKQGF